MTEAAVRAIRHLLARVCPDVILTRIVDQALADLLADISATTGSLRRSWTMLTGVAALATALAWSIITLRAYWREARWWPAPGVWRESLAWAVPLILLAAIRYEWALGEYAARPDALALVAYAAPVALPAA